jgi:hypothetical protein
VIAALLLGLAAIGPAAPVETRRQSIFVAWDFDTKTCVPQVNGVETGDIGTDAGKEALVVALPDKGVSISLIGKGGLAIPYSCVADIGTTLKRAGYYGRIGSISEAPPMQ